jgi:hypothetical protein
LPVLLDTDETVARSLGVKGMPHDESHMRYLRPSNGLVDRFGPAINRSRSGRRPPLPESCWPSCWPCCSAPARGRPLDSLLDFVTGQLRVRLGKLRQLRFVVDSRFHFERASLTGDVGLNLDDPVDLHQIASNRGGTPLSRHVGDFEADQRILRRGHIARSGRRRIAGICGIGHR